jgi:hypothetical protein
MWNFIQRSGNANPDITVLPAPSTLPGPIGATPETLSATGAQSRSFAAL